ncbi:hypothetical protein SAMN04488571_107139 [Methanoculleus thermophilus]|uniref:Uncharacterized protein n=1 Tax=Methanoculleus thermophilus TaxID=2200 RepID=A0A1G9B191_9EURY|nr:hypothetical protein SAMN04488571_107139 [Methanoculleus thermophilus]
MIARMFPRRDRGVSSRTAFAPHAAALTASIFSSANVSASMIRGTSGPAPRANADQASSVPG